MSALPIWVWDILADLLDEEDIHPKLYVEAFSVEDGLHHFVKYDWCPGSPLKHVPPEVLANARAIAAYRSARRGAEGAPITEGETK